MSDKTGNSKRTREIKALVLFSLAVFLLLALTSFDPRDPSFSHFISEPKGVNNLVGSVGSHIADLLILLFGVSAFLVPLFLLFAALKYLREESFSVSGGFLAGQLGVMVSVCCLTGLHIKTISYQEVDFPAGGLIGYFLIPFLYDSLKLTGTYLLFLAILIIALIAFFDISLQRMGSFILRSVLLPIHLFRSAWGSKRKKDGPAIAPEEETASPPISLPVDDIVRASPRKAERQAMKKTAPHAFNLPSLVLLDDAERKDSKVKKENLIANAKIIEKKLADFGVEGKIVEIRPGPVVTMYELEPAPGIKINRITNLADDLALAMKAQSVRIVAPIPGKAVVGLEIPNQEREVVRLKEVLQSEVFRETSYRLPVALGVDIVGTAVIADLVKMPHLLIAGTTGSGKSVALNAMICSILFKARPDEAKLLMIDPKRLELSYYEGIPHLLHPVVVDPKMASQALKWAVGEMERRYKIIGEVGAKGIEQYNQLVDLYLKDKPPLPKAKPLQDTLESLWTEGEGGKEDTVPLEQVSLQDKGNHLVRLPYIVIVIDELADLMMVAQRNVEESLARLAQMSRAAGIHLILATQRPSVDVITGIIKANFPTRISFQVSSKVDSRTIIDQHGAEKLLGAGDMLFIPPGSSRLVRIHGVYVSDKEIERIVESIRHQAKPAYDHSIVACEEATPEGDKGADDYDEKYDEAVELVTELGQASISLVQRYMKIGYNRAARIIEKMEAEGIVGPTDGVKPRKVLARKIPK